MKKGTNVFGAALIAYWIAILLGAFFPFKNNVDNLGILAIAGFILAAIFGFLDDKDKLF